MGSLKEKLKDLPLSMIAIPGSHNSASYDLQWKETDAGDRAYDSFYRDAKQLEMNGHPDEPFYQVKQFYGMNKHLGPDHYLKYNEYKALHPANEWKFFEAWNTCLRSNTTEQLQMGLRYFDYKYETIYFIETNFLHQTFENV